MFRRPALDLRRQCILTDPKPFQSLFATGLKNSKAAMSALTHWMLMEWRPNAGRSPADRSIRTVRGFLGNWVVVVIPPTVPSSGSIVRSDILRYKDSKAKLADDVVQATGAGPADRRLWLT